MSEILPNLTDEILHEKVTPSSVDTLLSRGVVVTTDVISSDELESMRMAVDTLYFESLPTRAICKLLERIPYEKTGTGIARQFSDRLQSKIYGKHSSTSQFDPNKLPLRLIGARPALDRIYELDAQFFEDSRLIEMYSDRPARLNIADASRALPGQKAFEAHQDSSSVVRLGHVAQGRDTRWTIFSGHEPSRTDYDYTFDAPEGSVVTTLERSGPRPARRVTAHGTQGFVKDGSEVHEGESLENLTRHRLAVFAGESIEEHGPLAKVRNRMVAALVEQIHSS